MPEDKIINVILDNPGQTEVVKLLFEGKGDDKINVDLNVVQTAPKTNSQILIVAIAAGEAQVTVHGKLFISEKANGAKGSMIFKTLVEGEKAKVTVFPDLEVKNKDAEAHHGVVTMRLPEAAIFYAENRGLSKTTANQLLKKSIIEEVNI
ncbi:MAG: SufD family Fe-S cluster assembly protein [candidate division WWE3 bacterium]|nr:SufD family Fe-S cluster assembly protein [candidate division WWE3 bacterium]